MLLLFMFTFVNANNKTAAQEEDNKLEFIFILHANQALVPYGDVANDLNYHRVLETLREHPSIPITLHVSGMLISDLQYFSPETLILVQDGIDDGQFEILGSTYAQNVPYSHYTPGSSNTAGGDFDNDLQIRVHKGILEERFGITPTSFWNPERVWDPDLILPMIQRGNYQSTFIEDHIIHQVATSDEHLVRTTGSLENPLYIFSDDRDLIFNETTASVGPVDAIAMGPQTG
ncbi:MAG: hypothetical protein ACXAD7_26585, partial [Candidatus Kariarchaeaceae archaeon]